jgi:diguanylate cyclase (GGDEF)-like protein
VSRNSLSQALGQSEHIHELIKTSVAELSSVTSDIKRELVGREPLQATSVAADKNDAIVERLQDASERLAEVNQALQNQIRDRIMVDHQFAAAVEQAAASRAAALHDTLTGLPNRALFVDRLEQGIARATRQRSMLAVMFVDLDNFKSINDTHGHQAGDAFLRSVAMRLERDARKDDTVSRYGGDELLYLLTPIHAHRDIARIAAKTLEAIRAPCQVRAGGLGVSACLEASIGISVFPANGATASALIDSADEAMYVAKRGRSGYAFARPDSVMQCGVSHRRPPAGKIASRNAPRVSDVESSTADQSL